MLQLLTLLLLVIINKCIAKLAITWEMKDTYDWHPGNFVVLLTSPITGERVRVKDLWAWQLEQAGKGKKFDIKCTWKENRTVKLDCIC